MPRARTIANPGHGIVVACQSIADATTSSLGLTAQLNLTATQLKPLHVLSWKRMRTDWTAVHASTVPRTCNRRSLPPPLAGGAY